MQTIKPKTTQYYLKLTLDPPNKGHLGSEPKVRLAAILVHITVHFILKIAQIRLSTLCQWGLLLLTSTLCCSSGNHY